MNCPMCGNEDFVLIDPTTNTYKCADCGYEKRKRAYRGARARARVRIRVKGGKHEG